MMLTQEDLCLRMNKYVLKSWNERKENELRAHLLVLRVETGNASQGKTLTLKEFDPCSKLQRIRGLSDL